MTGRVFSINISKTKGVAKSAVARVVLLAGHGLKDDAHAGPGIRQVSLLSIENIRSQSVRMESERSAGGIGPGDFAENITTEGIDLAGLKIGDTLKIGCAVLQISKIGKECARPCAIYHRLGDCVMPREGIFAKVVSGGEISAGDRIRVEEYV